MLKKFILILVSSMKFVSADCTTCGMVSTFGAADKNQFKEFENIDLIPSSFDKTESEYWKLKADWINAYHEANKCMDKAYDKMQLDMSQDIAKIIGITAIGYAQPYWVSKKHYPEIDKKIIPYKYQDITISCKSKLDSIASFETLVKNKLKSLQEKFKLTNAEKAEYYRGQGLVTDNMSNVLGLLPKHIKNKQLEIVIKYSRYDIYNIETGHLSNDKSFWKNNPHGSTLTPEVIKKNAETYLKNWGNMGMADSMAHAGYVLAGGAPVGPNDMVLPENMQNIPLATKAFRNAVNRGNVTGYYALMQLLKPEADKTGSYDEFIKTLLHAKAFNPDDTTKYAQTIKDDLKNKFPDIKYFIKI